MSCNGGCRSYPNLVLQDGRNLGDIEWQGKGDLLTFEEALNKYDDFWVFEKKSEIRLEGLWRKFGWDYISAPVTCSIIKHDEKSLPILKKVARMGFDLDNQDKDSWVTASHICSQLASVEGAKLLALCRPDLSLKDDLLRTPEKSAKAEMKYSPEKKQYLRAILKIWRAADEKGFPTMAQLACDKHFWALQSLYRRRVIPEDEVELTHEGKTALEWLEFYGEKKLAREYRYYFDMEASSGDEEVSGYSWSEEEVSSEEELSEDDEAAADARPEIAIKRKHEAEEEDDIGPVVKKPKEDQGEEEIEVKSAE